MTIDKKYNKIQVFRNGLVTFYNPDVIGSITSYRTPLGEYGVDVDIIADGRCNRDSFRFLLREVTNQVTWTDDVAGANIAVDTIASWADPFASGLATEVTLSAINAGTPDSLGQKNMVNSMPVVIASNQNNGNNSPGFVRVTNSGLLNFTIQSFAVANVGIADGILLGQTIKKGEILEFEAATFYVYAANTITYDATGTEFLITYNR